jgi:hypothetical protein
LLRKLRWAGSNIVLLAVASTAGVSCFTYSASIAVDSGVVRPRCPLSDALAVTVSDVASAHNMQLSPTDLAGMKKAASDVGSDYHPVAVYRGTNRKRLSSPNRVLLVLQERASDCAPRIIIRDLEYSEETEFTLSIEQEIVKQLRAEVGSEAVQIQRGRVGPNLYAP